MKNKTQSHNHLFKVIPLKQLPYSQEVSRRLNGGSKREEIAQLVDYRTPFFAVKGSDKAKVVQSSRISGVDGLRPTKRSDIVEAAYRIVMPHIKDIPEYVEGEEKYLKYKDSSRSVRVPYSAREEGTMIPYFRNAQRELSDEAKEAIKRSLSIGEESIRALIPEKSLRLLSFEEAAQELPGTTNGGLPYLVSGTVVSQGKILEDNRPKYIEMAKKLSYQPLTDKLILENAFILGGRGQESNDVKDQFEGVVKPKQRSVGAEGHAWSIIGNRMKPFLDARKKDSRRAALVSQSAVDSVIYNEMNKLQENQIVISGDGSTYDSGMLKWIALEIGEIIIRSFNASAQDVESMRRYFNHVFSDPIVTPKGLYGGTHGMPSGTTFTNELDSCYNEVLAGAVQFLPKKVNPLAMKLDMVTDQGDDAVQVCTLPSGLVDSKEIADVLSKCYQELNMSVNPKKQRISRTSVEYLKRLHLKGKMESYRSYVGTTIGLCNMERAKAGKFDMYTARYIMQTANHYASLPGFNDFMKFVSEGDKELHIGVGIQGGAYTIFQRAGGVPVVLKRLGMTSYATHLGVDHSEAEAKLASVLSSAQGVESQNRKLKR